MIIFFYRLFKINTSYNNNHYCNINNHNNNHSKIEFKMLSTEEKKLSKDINDFNEKI
jgi:hypothetical protein